MATEAESQPVEETAKRSFLLCRWLIILVSSLIILASERLRVGAAAAYIFVSCLLLSNIFLHFVSAASFSRPALYSSVGIADVFLITLALLLSGQTASDFYLTYFLVIIISALSASLLRIILSTSLVILVYGSILVLNEYASGFHDATILLRLPFFFVVALFYGHLVQLVRAKESDKQKSMGLAEEARKFSREQVQTNTRLSRLLEEQNALREMLRQISVLDMGELLRKIAQQSLRLLRVDHVHIRILTPNGLLKAVAAAGTQAERLTERSQKVDFGRSGWVVKNLKPLVISDVSQDKEFGAGHIMREEGIQSYLGLPLTARGHQAVGVLVAQSRDRRVFTEDEVSLAQEFAAGAAIAIENARLFTEVNDKTRSLQEANSHLIRLLDEQRALREILTQINVLDMHELLGKLTEQGRSLLCADHIQVRLLDKTGSLQTVALAGEGAELMGSQTLTSGRRRSTWVIKNRKPMAVRDISEDLVFGPGHRMKEIGVKGYLCVPLISRGHNAIGVLQATSLRARDFTENEIAVAEQLAGGAAVVIENARLFEEVKNKTQEIAQASESKSEFLNLMAHELRTPLNVIIGHTELLKEGFYGEVGERMTRALETTEDNARSLLKVINEILDLARLESRKVVLKLEECSVKELMDELRLSFAPLVGEKGLELKLELDERDLRVTTDRDKIKGILQNLVANAIKYTDGGQVELRVLRDPRSQTWQLSVSDTGIGINAEDRARIFEPFQMVEGLDREKYPGSGLGLTLVHRLVELLSGAIKVESEPGKGSTFTVILPLEHGAAATEVGTDAA
jgi:signal transduction histidine kinase